MLVLAVLTTPSIAASRPSPRRGEALIDTRNRTDFHIKLQTDAPAPALAASASREPIKAAELLLHQGVLHQGRGALFGAWPDVGTFHPTVSFPFNLSASRAAVHSSPPPPSRTPPSPPPPPPQPSPPPPSHHQITHEPTRTTRGSVEKVGYGSSYPFVLLHTSHEGSHGFGDTLASVPCVDFVNKESFDFHINNLVPDSNQTQQQLERLRNFFMQPIVQTVGTSPINASNCSCEARGVILRSFTEVLCPLGVRAFIIVRTDLLRWSLSTYSEHHVEHLPQFKQNYTAPIVQVNIRGLAAAARANVERWEKSAAQALDLIHCGLNPRLISFEYFEDVQAPPPSLTKALTHNGECSERGADRNVVHTVQQVHSRQISSFVSNAGEVYAHFATTRYPSFAEVFSSVSDHVDGDIFWTRQ